jgi:hypothetical protein
MVWSIRKSNPERTGTRTRTENTANGVCVLRVCQEGFYPVFYNYFVRMAVCGVWCPYHTVGFHTFMTGAIESGFRQETLLKISLEVNLVK